VRRVAARRRVAAAVIGSFMVMGRLRIVYGEAGIWVGNKEGNEY
jgi:hypothetical protein